jgi:2-C-methyl-D-erythritol 4-phosphate cytidylyltransferase / 2-C-methyl-D-erythritol 2,4-cyclodiphosphate synthase
MTTAAVIVAAGRGTRAGGDLPKQWQLLAGKAVLSRTLAAFDGAVDRIVLVIHPDDRAQAQAIAPHVQIVEGGATRDGSVRNALLALDGAGVTRVLIHDGARPLVSRALIARMIGLKIAPACGGRKPRRPFALPIFCAPIAPIRAVRPMM